MTYFVVARTRGAAWDARLPMRQQRGWHEHANFMDGLVAEGFVILGGPLGDGETILLVVKANHDDVVVRQLAQDPWSASELLSLERVTPWQVLLSRSAIPD